MPCVESSKTEWLAVDWGTSCLRVWKIDSTGAVVGHSNTPDGAAELTPTMFAPLLTTIAADAVSPTHKLPALVCGMAGARNRWIEAPYLSVPCSPFAVVDSLTRAPAEQLAVHIVPGISQESPCDVMRGEETQIAGLLATRPDFCGVICLPGTHTKWGRVENGKILSFTTLMSGELYYLFAKISMLRRSVESDTWDEDEFLTAVETTVAAPQKTATVLFSIRAESLLRDLSKSAARARLSGYLMGLELAATKEYWQNDSVAIIGENILCRQYKLALTAQNTHTDSFTSDKMSLAGLIQFYNMKMK